MANARRAGRARGKARMGNELVNEFGDVRMDGRRGLPDRPDAPAGEAVPERKYRPGYALLAALVLSVILWVGIVLLFIRLWHRF